jgi:lipoprotein-anchoring transpeptidase ErfK/SrfK
VLRTLVAFVLVAGLACAAAPASERTHVIPAHVTIGTLRAAGLISEPARARVEAAYTRPITIRYRDERVAVDPAKLGLHVNASAAVSAALVATPGSTIDVPLRYSRKAVDALVAKIAARYNRAPVSATVVGANAAGPEFTAAKTGLAVDQRTLRAAIRNLVTTGSRDPLYVTTRTLLPARTPANYGPIVVVDRSANSLRLFDGRSAVRTFRVATGQAIYPTPAGLWRIADKQRNPWWYPPTYDEWAKGLKPVPPGPSNPLGTRWMGLNAPGVGIHGTDAPTSIGYSASHGCIRMHVPEAEWLFERVNVGTPVVIL